MSDTKNKSWEGQMKKKYFNIDVSRYVCQNEGCEAYKKSNLDNHVIFHHFQKNKNFKTMYLQCKICNKIFSEYKGTLFFNKKKDKETIVRALKSASEGTGIRATGRIFDVNRNTILSWVQEAGRRCKDIEDFFSKSSSKGGSD